MPSFNIDFFKIMRDEGLCRNPINMRFHMWQLFESYNFTDRTVLDIGGGRGQLSFFAASQNASYVKCLEPSLDGSNSDCQELFRRITAKYKLDSVHLCPITFQDYSISRSEQFDCVISNASINHLDENACANLLIDSSARERFRGIAASMRDALNPGGQLVIADCFRRNLWSDLGFRNPITTSIERHLHHQPSIWISIFKESGLRLTGLRYSTFNSFGKAGSLLMNNWLSAYCLTGDFVLTFERPRD